MARGELGIRILEHFQGAPEAQTVKQIKDALGASSGGAIGYALDKLVTEGTVIKLAGKPARYHPAGSGDASSPGVIVQPPPKPPRVRVRHAAPAEEEEEEERPSRRKGEGRTSPCGFCMSSKNMDYHMKHCRGVIPGASAGADWTCSCYASGHSRASDYLKSQAGQETAAVEQDHNGTSA